MLPAAWALDFAQNESCLLGTEQLLGAILNLYCSLTKLDAATE